MSNTILGGNFTIYYLDENRQKRIKWSGAAAGTNTMNELYSALQDHFDESLQMDDGVPMSAQTPVEYTIGMIDSGDLNPWYISYETMEHLTGGALKTSGWTRDLPGNGAGAIGIVVAPVTAATRAIVTGDIGLDITHADGDTGTLLDVIDSGGATDYLVIRPNSNALANDFNSGSGNLTCGGHTAAQTAAATTGEQIWANLYSIGTIEADTHIYFYQGTVKDGTRARLVSVIDDTQDWWTDGHVDRCVAIRDYTAAGNPVIDSGYIAVFVRKGNTLYDSYSVANSETSGGRNPIPLASAPDLDNITGYKSITFTATANNWAVGNEMSGDDSGARAIITKIVSPGATQTVHYYLIDDPLTDFNTAVENLTNEDDTGTGTKNGSVPADQGPALNTWFTANTPPTIGTGGHTYVASDIDDDSNNEYYAVTIDCNQNPLTEVYEWLKYITRRGNTVTTDTDGIEAEQYVGGEVYLAWSGSVTGTIAEGADVTQAGSGATGIIQAYSAASKIMLLRDVRGTFNTTGVVTDNDNSGTVTPNSAAVTFSPKKQSPFGTFAGGTFFGARGVLLSDWLPADENSFQLTPIEGGTKERPTAITIEVTNLVGTDETTIDDDRVTIFRLTGAGGSIDKTEYSAAGGEAIGDITLVVDVSIEQDVPGKTTGGILRLRDASSNNKEYRIRYDSWVTATFTLSNIDIASADAGTDTDTIVKSGAFTNAKRGDLVYNHNRSAVSYVKSVDDANTVQISPAIALQVPGDHIELNCCPIAVNTADDVFVPLVDEHATSGSASASIVYSATIHFRVVVRNSVNATPIIPFSTDGLTSGADKSIAVVRSEDTIIT